ncbi:AI-2E family transporter [Streptomyces fagopyri]|uniref:AI-2E family transporter n=1 Tax=Streptomyces fagopyri TaxID=2662397 RepID=A0A5Q0LHG2_9ACTN|nr:AI-2E family transporter [Streptomyces fagopyri]
MADGSRRAHGRPGAPGTGPAPPPDAGRGSGRGGRRARYVVRGSRPAGGVGAAIRARTAGAVAGRGGDRDGVPVNVNGGLRVAAAYAWRLLVLGAAAYACFKILGRLQLVAVALFLALVVTSVLRPVANLLARWLPRGPATAVSLFGSLLLALGLLSLVGGLVAGESDRLGQEFAGGAGRIERWLEGSPFHVDHAALANLQEKVTAYLSEHRSALLSSALSGAGRVLEVLTAAALALFCSLFFIHSGERFWHWFQALLPESARDTWDRAGRAAWRTFAGYTRGIIIVAATNAVLVGIALFLLGVPLALPLTLLEFFAAFIPLVGSPVALAVATVVALASRGPVIALVVLSLIVVVGQLEGHVLHPLVLSWAVRLHPVVVALSVIGGGVLAGVIGAVVAVPMVSVAWSVFGALRTPPVPDPRPPGEPAGKLSGGPADEPTVRPSGEPRR